MSERVAVRYFVEKHGPAGVAQTSADVRSPLISTAAQGPCLVAQNPTRVESLPVESWDVLRWMFGRPDGVFALDMFFPYVSPRRVVDPVWSLVLPSGQGAALSLESHSLLICQGNGRGQCHEEEDPWRSNG